MRPIKTIILDFDGVVVESNEEKTTAFKELFSLYSPYQNAMLQYHLDHFSTSRMKKFEHYVFNLMGRPDDMESVDRMAEQFSELVIQRVVSCPEVPGARMLLEEFSEQVPIYVSSATPQNELKKIVRSRGIDRYFKSLFGDPPCKKETAVRRILKQERILPSEVVFIGDAPSDYRVARQLGLEFAGRDSGLSFDDIDIVLYDDLIQISDVIRARIGR